MVSAQANQMPGGTKDLDLWVREWVRECNIAKLGGVWNMGREGVECLVLG